MSTHDALIRSLRLQAAGCLAYGSAFSAAMLEAMASDVESGGPTLALFAPWAEADTRALITGAVPLRLLGGLHDLVLSGEAPALARAYPTDAWAGDPAMAWSRALVEFERRHDRLTAFMAHEPQTNEVRRSACLLPGFLTIAESGLPLRCFEVGASAGLNQLWDRWRYQLDGAGVWGAPDAPVSIDTDWRGPPPPLTATVSVIERAACDRKPVDLSQPAERRRLGAYVWPDQRDRLRRLEAAIGATLAAGVRVEAEDAVAWTRRRAAPRPGAATVLLHSVFWQYMPAQSQADLAGAIAEHGGAATREGPFAWLRMEPASTNLAEMELRLTSWPGGEERQLALVHPHGAWIEWRGAAA